MEDSDYYQKGAAAEEGYDQHAEYDGYENYQGYDNPMQHASEDQYYPHSHHAEEHAQGYATPQAAACCTMPSVCEGVLCSTKATLDKFKLSINICLSIVMGIHVVSLVPPVAIPASPFTAFTMYPLLSPIVGIAASFVMMHAMRLEVYQVLNIIVATCVEIFHLIFTFSIAVAISASFSGSSYAPSEAATVVGINIILGLIHIALLAMMVAHVLLTRRWQKLQQSA